MATLKEIQNCELEILKAVADVCDRNGIEYFLSAGTLLGAVRHKGFIPWDDDIDIIIKLDDIKRFKKACLQSRPDKFFYQDCRTDKGTPYIFPKIRNRNTYMPESKSATLNQGIWIDVFPVIAAGSTEQRLKKQIFYINRYQYYSANQIKITKTRYSSLPSMLFRIARELLCYRPLTAFYYHRILRLADFDSDAYIPLDGAFFGAYSDEMVSFVINKRMLNKKLFENRSLYLFEDRQFYSFSDYDGFLSKIYGKDYMTPKRYSHFSDYSNVRLE